MSVDSVAHQNSAIRPNKKRAKSRLEITLFGRETRGQTQYHSS